MLLKPEVCTPENHKVWGQCLPADHLLKEHDYCKGQVELHSMNMEQSIANELLELHCRITELEEENESLNFLLIRFVFLDHILDS